MPTPDDLPPKKDDLRPAQTLEEAIRRIHNITRRLRRECPWDRKQTFDSIRHLTIEEVYELSDAIMRKDWDAIQEELGDVLLHVLFYSVMGEEQGKFNFIDVVNRLADKLIERHPHVYGNLEVHDAETVKRNWEQIKGKRRRRSVLEGVPDSMPSLIKAYRLQEKAGQYGFDWDNADQVREKVLEEWQEFEASRHNREKAEEEFGDLLFALVNYARHLGINPDTALEKANRKFRRRFEAIEAEARRQNRRLEEMTLEEMDQIWNQAKDQENS